MELPQPCPNLGVAFPHQSNRTLTLKGGGIEGALFEGYKWVWLKIKQVGLRRFWSMFPLTRVDFGSGFLSHSQIEVPCLKVTNQQGLNELKGELFALQAGSSSHGLLLSWPRFLRLLYACEHPERVTRTATRGRRRPPRRLLL